MWEQTFPGTADQIGRVRAALRPLLRDCPIADDIILLLSELCANAVAHSASGKPGGKFTVRLQHFRGEYVRGEVEDEGSHWDGNLWDSARDASGLFLVVKLASACGVAHGAEWNRVVWFRSEYPAADRRAMRLDTTIRTSADVPSNPASTPKSRAHPCALANRVTP